MDEKHAHSQTNIRYRKSTDCECVCIYLCQNLTRLRVLSVGGNQLLRMYTAPPTRRYYPVVYRIVSYLLILLSFATHFISVYSAQNFDKARKCTEFGCVMHFSAVVIPLFVPTTTTNRLGVGARAK